MSSNSMVRRRASVFGLILLVTTLLPSAIDAVESGATISIDGCTFERTFRDDFSHLVVQPTSYAGRGWIAHTPWSGDFGDAAFANPSPDFPFRRVDGVLQIEARKGADGRWRSGLLASADGRGNGFGQTYGYFETSAMLPSGEGVWPAFWLATKQPKGTKTPSLEIDALEQYGHFPADFHSAYHLWNAGPNAPKGEHVTPVVRDSLSSAFHTYGVDVEPDFISFYFDRNRTWRVPTPPEHKRPLLILLDLALGSGWPIVKTPNPSFLKVAYVQVFRRIDPVCH